MSMIPKFLKKEIVDRLAGENLYLMLLKDTHIQDAANQQFISQVSTNEVEDIGDVYTAGGFKLNGAVGSYDGNDAFLDFTTNPAIGPGAYLNYQYIAIYKKTSTPADSPIRCIIKMPINQIVTNGTSTITWNALGVLLFT